jgi:leader peptidase (prepilin peptidase) / N-methyltransferase
VTETFLVILGALLFVTGTVVGSFLNVCIYRIPWEKSIIWPHSCCPNCRHAIAARDNVPIVGWLALRGRCRHCAAPISPRYPLVEGLVGLLFVGAFLADVAARPDVLQGGVLAEASVRLAYHLILIGLLVVATFIDFDLYIIPDEVTVPGMVLGVALGALVPGVRLDPAAPGPVAVATHAEGLWMGVQGLLVGGGLIWAVRIVAGKVFGREAMGFGDVTLLAMIGSFLGWQAAVLTFFLSPFSGLPHALGKLVATLIKRLRGRPRAEADREIPFGPYLSLAATVLVLGWPWIWWGWAKGLFHQFSVVFWYMAGQER